MNFPEYISFTVTNSCNLRCRMCGQWSEEGYIHNRVKNPGSQMELADWKRLVDEVAAYKIRFILVRGGEPFLFPGIIELVEHIHSKGIFVSIDTNGTVMSKYAADLVRIGNMHITFSVDGPEEIHDNVRGKKGSFQKTKENIALLHELEKNNAHKISKSLCFTISQYSYQGLGAMPEIARSMGISSINIVPYYYFSNETGKKYETELMEHFDCPAYSWKGFHHEDSGIDFNIFREEFRKYHANLGEVSNFPYMPLTEDEYRVWFADQVTPVGLLSCMNVEKLIDIQSDGEANFCVDFPDYSFGNVKESSIKKIWNSPRANRFQEYRRQNPLAICYRCGAKYIAEIRD
ncbi:radical SAM protein [candidate division KSB1 bacterium]|nr:radical SAM protein [candidate division KSB1 bacterium]